MAKDISKEEAQERVNKAFDILFDAVFRMERESKNDVETK